MKFQKKLLISGFGKDNMIKFPYYIKVKTEGRFFDNHESEIRFDDKSLEMYGIKPSLDLVGRILIIILESKRMIPGDNGNGLKPYDLLVRGSKKEQSKYQGTDYVGVFSSPNPLDKIRSSFLPELFYELTLYINKVEYNKLKELKNSSDRYLKNINKQMILIRPQFRLKNSY